MDRKRRWHIYATNCDCYSDMRAYPYRPRWIIGPRCKGCGKVLGFMEYSYWGWVHATDELEALKLKHETKDAPKLLLRARADYAARKV